uniref:Amino acid transporter transmembrane domain-containing protein n=2 Tax=Photinus pyralis TaxID=7054 RepID=A0A1Y1KK33_PHOPY
MGSCCVYLVFIAVNVEAVVSQYTEGYGTEMYILMFLVPLVLINWIRDLKRLAPLSTVANCVTLVSLAIILYYTIERGPTFSARKPVGDLRDFPLFFGTVIFAIEAIGVIIPLENEMKHPQAFGGTFGVLNQGMGAIVVLYGCVGLLGYLSYGSTTEGTVTLNLPKDEIVAQIVKVSLASSIFISYTIQYYVAIDIAWNHYLGPKFEKHPRVGLIEYTLRTFLVVLTCEYSSLRQFQYECCCRRLGGSSSGSGFIYIALWSAVFVGRWNCNTCSD